MAESKPEELTPQQMRERIEHLEKRLGIKHDTRSAKERKEALVRGRKRH